MNQLSILTTKSSSDYELLDSGEGEKLERFGKYILSRPDPQALWHKRLPQSEWKKADGHFTNSWSLKKDVPDKWQIDFGGLKFWIRPSSFKHTGLFPEQEANWKWVREQLEKAKKPSGPESRRLEGQRSKEENIEQEVEVLNLFGYTGGASLAAAQAGAKVVHVDGSKVAITWARENAELSGLKDKPIRWILDDARAFVKREIKRERKYAGIIMDPPAFGHGPENELWKIEEHFLALLDDCIKILADEPLFFLINGYSAGYSAIAYENALLPLKVKFGGNVEIGELVIEEREEVGGMRLENEGQKTETRKLPAGIFARWSKS